VVVVDRRNFFQGEEREMRDFAAEKGKGERYAILFNDGKAMGQQVPHHTPY
jgi:diadenosine tetraphosphate (Ap4A) HIT family hydrolase